MSGTITISPSLLATILTITGGIGASLIGIIYRRLRSGVTDNEDSVESLEKRLEKIDEKVSTLFSWAFGSEYNEADRGISQDVDDGFNELNARLDQIESKHDKQHEEVVQRLDRITNALHDEENIDIDRDDINAD